MMPIKC